MTAQKSEPGGSRSLSSTAPVRNEATADGEGKRKPWIKKSTKDIIHEQAERLRKEIAEDEESLKRKKAELKPIDDLDKQLQSI